MRKVHIAILFAAACLTALRAQAPAAAPAGAEVNTQEAPVVFRSVTTVVPVAVVVRDGAGNAVGNLTAADFRLLDDGKPQYISKFGVEKLDRTAAASAPKPAVLAPGEIAEATTEGIPDRFAAYLFDDMHLEAGDLINVRIAARKHIARLDPSTRAAIYTTSGQVMLEFTADREKLDKALVAVQPSAGYGREDSDCPPINYYFADMIEQRHDTGALDIAVQDTVVCAGLELPKDYDIALRMVQARTRSVYVIGRTDTNATLQTMTNIIRRMSAMPGQRMVVLVSPGFYVNSDNSDAEGLLIERAIRSGVVVNSINARGVYARIPGGSASQRLLNTQTMAAKQRYLTASDMDSSMTLASISAATGGTLTANSNDMDEGFRRAAAAPEYIYVLNFSPQEMKFDGKFHNLKVSLLSSKGLEVQARKGYYAPKKATEPAEMRRQEMEETLFSRDERHDLPAILQTQYFKTSENEASLSVIAKVDVRKLTFHKEGDRNRNDLTILAALFDDNGNYVSGMQKTVELRLLDSTLALRLATGMGVKSNFTVAPGKYMVRVVVRDSEAQTVAAQTSVVEIP